MRIRCVVTAVLDLATAGACRHEPRTLPTEPPYFEGRMGQRSFAKDSGGPAGLWLICVKRLRDGDGVTPEGYFRMDSLTHVVDATHGRLKWDVKSSPSWNRSFVRVWTRGVPPSRTSLEVWGRADIVVIDSVGR